MLGSWALPVWRRKKSLDARQIKQCVPLRSLPLEVKCACICAGKELRFTQDECVVRSPGCCHLKSSSCPRTVKSPVHSCMPLIQVLPDSSWCHSIIVFHIEQQHQQKHQRKHERRQSWHSNKCQTRTSTRKLAQHEQTKTRTTTHTHDDSHDRNNAQGTRKKATTCMSVMRLHKNTKHDDTQSTMTAFRPRDCKKAAPWR